MLKILAFVFMGMLVQPPGKTINPEYQDFLDHIYPANVHTITIREFKRMNKEGVYVLDTREKNEYQVSHLKIARQVGFFWFDMRDVYDIPKKATVIVYCTIGNRSGRIAEKLIGANYQSVYVLYGGIFEWVNQGNPVYTKQDIQTPEVHVYNKEMSKWLEKGNKIL